MNSLRYFGNNYTFIYYFHYTDKDKVSTGLYSVVSLTNESETIGITETQRAHSGTLTSF
jgi:hypothetical protein